MAPVNYINYPDPVPTIVGTDAQTRQHFAIGPTSPLELFQTRHVHIAVIKAQIELYDLAQDVKNWCLTYTPSAMESHLQEFINIAGARMDFIKKWQGNLLGLRRSLQDMSDRGRALLSEPHELPNHEHVRIENGQVKLYGYTMRLNAAARLIMESKNELQVFIDAINTAYATEGRDASLTAYRALESTCAVMHSKFVHTAEIMAWTFEPSYEPVPATIRSSFETLVPAVAANTFETILGTVPAAAPAGNFSQPTLPVMTVPDAPSALHPPPAVVVQQAQPTQVTQRTPSAQSAQSSQSSQSREYTQSSQRAQAAQSTQPTQRSQTAQQAQSSRRLQSQQRVYPVPPYQLAPRSEASKIIRSSQLITPIMPTSPFVANFPNATLQPPQRSQPIDIPGPRRARPSRQTGNIAPVLDRLSMDTSPDYGNFSPEHELQFEMEPSFAAVAPYFNPTHPDKHPERNAIFRTDPVFGSEPAFDPMASTF